MSDSTPLEYIEIDEYRLNQMKLAVLQAEKRNVNTQELSNPEMVELLKRTIIDYAEKTF